MKLFCVTEKFRDHICKETDTVSDTQQRLNKASNCKTLWLACDLFTPHNLHFKEEPEACKRLVIWLRSCWAGMKTHTHQFPSQYIFPITHYFNCLIKTGRPIRKDKSFPGLEPWEAVALRTATWTALSQATTNVLDDSFTRKVKAFLYHWFLNHRPIVKPKGIVENEVI